MIAIQSLGQADVITTGKRTAYRPMALQYAVSAVLRAAEDLTPFPGRIVDLAAQRFNALVNEVVETANQPGWATNPGYTWTPAFTEAEAIKGLNQVGYRSALPVEIPVVVAAAPVYQAPRLPQPDTTRQVVVTVPGIQPVPSPPPVRAPVMVQERIIQQPGIPPSTRESALQPPGAAAKKDGNPLLWAAAVIVVGVFVMKGKPRETPKSPGGRK